MGRMIMKSEIELWKALPGVPGVEVSTFGNVRTLDRVVSSEHGTRFIKGHILNRYVSSLGYLNVSIPIDDKWTKKLVHRVVAKTFISNPDNLLEVNHKNCIRNDNRVSNLEWCSKSYNQQYREKFGEASGHPVFAINLATQEVLRFRSQHEAGRVLGIFNSNITAVIKGKRKQTGGFWFTNADDKADDIIKKKLNNIKGES